MKLLDKRFYSEGIIISLCFNQNGSLTGEIFNKSENSNSLRKELSGIFIRDEPRITLSFFTEITGILTVYTGEIFYYPPDEECMLLRFWASSELFEFSNSKSLLLFDCPHKNRIIETRKAFYFIPEIIFA
jgi:hypothetical protein